MHNRAVRLTVRLTLKLLGREHSGGPDHSVAGHVLVGFKTHSLKYLRRGFDMDKGIAVDFLLTVVEEDAL